MGHDDMQDKSKLLPPLSRREVIGAMAGAAVLATAVRAAPLRAAPAGAPNVDVHHHLLPPAQLTQLAPHGARILPVLKEWSPQKSLDALDAAGIRLAMLSITNPGLWFEDERAATLARACNEYAATLRRDYPGRFDFFATLPLPDVDAALKEAEYALDTLGASGIHFFTSYQGKYLGDPAFAPLMKELGRRGVVAYVHPNSSGCCSNLLPGLPDNVIELGTETARTIASLLFSGTASSRAGMKFIFSHAGGTMPSVIERFEYLARSREELNLSVEWVRASLAEFYYDTAQAANRTNLTALATIVSSSQFLFGSDYPFREIAEQVASLERSGLGRREVKGVLAGNFAALLGGARVNDTNGRTAP